MNETAVTEWMEGYIKAWKSNSPDDIRALFTEDALYEFSPSDSEPLRGIDAIVEDWITDRDERGTWSFTWEPLVVTDELAIVQGQTKYSNKSDFDNLWVIRFAPDGRATRFTEWYMDIADQ
jgi:hypothetical protein